MMLFASLRFAKDILREKRTSRAVPGSRFLVLSGQKSPDFSAEAMWLKNSLVSVSGFAPPSLRLRNDARLVVRRERAVHGNRFHIVSKSFGRALPA